jgi:hypothetical protein
MHLLFEQHTEKKGECEVHRRGATLSTCTTS